MAVSGFHAFKLLHEARRVIMGIVVNHELEMTEIRQEMRICQMLTSKPHIFYA